MKRKFIPEVEIPGIGIWALGILVVGVLFLTIRWRQLSDKLPTVVKIEVQSKDGNSWSGSGVFVEDNLILTAGHIVGNAEDIWIVWKNKKHKAIKWYQETEADLGVVVINTPEREPTAILCNAKLKQKVWACGAPYAYFPVWTQGIISAINVKTNILQSDMGKGPFFITDCPLVPGNSGCPILDNKNRILGIYSWHFTNEEGMNFCIPAETCKLVLEKYKTLEGVE